MCDTKILRWPIDPKIFSNEDYILDNMVALQSSKQGYEQISKKYTHIHPFDIGKVLSLSESVNNALSGEGIDLGGGVGSVASVVALSPSVESIICLELTENCVKHCHKVVIPEILGDLSDKVISVIGDFDHLVLDDNSLDFAIAWDALHHSPDIMKTLSEIKRVLKPSGSLVLVDRAHNNSTSDEEIQRMQNIQYPKEYLIENHLPPDKILRRIDNGEREYRYSDWEEFFKGAGFEKIHGYIVKERHEKNVNYSNDAGLDEFYVDYELGGFERRKIIYVFHKI